VDILRAFRQGLRERACFLTSSPVYWLGLRLPRPVLEGRVVQRWRGHVGSTITLPRSGYMLGMAVQPEKVNEVDAEPSSS
jgi:hypothetical protein